MSAFYEMLSAKSKGCINMEYWTITVIKDSFFDYKIKYKLQKFKQTGEKSNLYICCLECGRDYFVFNKKEKQELLDFIKSNNIKIKAIDRKNVDLTIKKGLNF